MQTVNIIFLSFVQGFSEFLPVSSSAHLLVLEKIFNMPENLLLDVSLHIGTLFAILIYFYKEVQKLIFGLTDVAFLKKTTNQKMLLKFVVASLPAIFVGFVVVFFDLLKILRSPFFVACNLMIFGVLFYLIDKNSKVGKDFDKISFKDAFLIGVAQCLAFIPGVSRSGATISMSRFLKIERADSAKFSMLLSIPTILGAFILVLYSLITTKGLQKEMLFSILLGSFFSFLFGLFFIAFLIKFLKNHNLFIFMIYRLILGLFLLIYFYM